MKRYLLLIVIFVVGISYANSQSDESVLYLLPEFEEGVINFKNGSQLKEKLNYSFLMNQFCRHVEDEQMNVLIWNENIKDIQIDNRTFTKNGEYVVEVLSTTPVIQVYYKKSITEAKPTGGYGIPSGTSNIPTLNPMDQAYGIWRIGEIDLSKLKIGKLQHTYWLEKDGEALSFKNAKQLTNIYPDRKVEIKKYIKQNKVKFDNVNQVVSLIKHITGS